MNIVEQKITIHNLVNTIDRTVLQLRRVKKGEEFSTKLKKQIINIFNFTIESNTDEFSNALYNKGVFIERESLEVFHKNLVNFNFPKEEFEQILSNVMDLDSNNFDEIEKIQSVLVRISIPIWETIQELKNG